MVHFFLNGIRLICTDLSCIYFLNNNFSVVVTNTKESYYPTDDGLSWVGNVRVGYVLGGDCPDGKCPGRDFPGGDRPRTRADFNPREDIASQIHV